MPVFQHRMPRRIDYEKEYADFIIYSANPRNRNPKIEVDNAINGCVGENEYNEFVEEWLDNPWIRIAIIGIEYLDYKHFNEMVKYAKVEFEGLNGKKVEVYVLFIPKGTENPKQILDDAVLKIADGRSYNAFIDSSLCNPYLRVLIIGLNDFNWKY